MKKAFFCFILVILNTQIYSFDYSILKEYMGKNIITIRQILPNLENIDGDIYLSEKNMENMMHSFLSKLSDNNTDQAVILDILNEIIIGFNYFIDFKDENLAQATFEKFKNENIATEFSTIFDDTFNEYRWFNLLNNYITHVTLRKYDGVFSVNIGCGWYP